MCKSIYTNKKIKTVSAPCGRGKTYSLGAHIKKTRYKRNHLIVMPSLILIDSVKKDFAKDHGIDNIIEITSNTGSSVRKSAIEFFKSAEDTGQVVLMTWQGFQDLQYFNRRENWDVYVDEIPQVDEFLPITVPFNGHHVVDYIEIDEPQNETIATLKIKDGCENELQKFVDRPRDQVTDNFIPLYRALLSKTKDVFVDMTSWNRIFENKIIDESKCSYDSDMKHSKNRVFFLSMVNPHEWNGVTLMGANIESSMLFNWFTNYHGVSFPENKDIIRNLREENNVVPLGERLNVSYFFNSRGFSKYLGKNKPKNHDQSYLTMMDETVQKKFGENDFLYVSNNDYNSTALEDNKNVRKMPVIAHGLNEFDKYTNIYFSAALNREPAHIRMLNELGFNNELIRTATTHEVIYQSIMRTALRKPDSKETVNVIVPDQYSANRLIEIFGGGNKKWIGDKKFKKVIPFTQQERNNRSRFFKKKGILFNDNDQHFTRTSLRVDETATRTSSPSHGDNFNSGSILDNSKCTRSGTNYLIKENSNQISTTKGRRTSKVLSVTFHKDKYAIDQNEFIIEEMMPLEFVNLMKDASKTVIEKKDESFMVNSTVFDPSINTDGYRRQDNFVSSSIMILDFDNGDLSPEEFERIFWTDAGKGNKRSFVICNSFSRSKDEPNNFRVFLFYKQPATSLEEHQAIYDSIVERLKANEYTESSSKLDRACRTGNQSYYIPCINREHKEYAFFRKYGLDKTRDIQRYGINPISYTKTSVIPFERVKVYSEKKCDTYITDIDKESTISNSKLKVMNMKENRYRPFFLLAVKMRSMGLPKHEIENHLMEVEQLIGKEKEHWTKGAMKSLNSRNKYNYG